jgi:hypothetical protein
VQTLVFSVCGRKIGFPSIRVKDQRSCCALRDAGRLPPEFKSLNAEAAFPHGALCRTELWYVERARLDAISASYAPGPDVLNNSIRPPAESSGRAGRDAGGIAAMKTCSRNRSQAAGREFSHNVSFHPAQLNTRRGVVLQLTADLARVAGYACPGIKNNQWFHSNVGSAGSAGGTPATASLVNLSPMNGGNMLPHGKLPFAGKTSSLH